MNHNMFTKDPHSFKPYRHCTKKQILLLTMLATALDDQTSRSIRIGLVGGVDKQIDSQEVELMRHFYYAFNEDYRRDCDEQGYLAVRLPYGLDRSDNSNEVWGMLNDIREYRRHDW